jgi:sulfoxide reductase heme-binding subunit YedZ
MHLATFVVLDYGLDWTQIWQTVVEKRYILAGLTSFLAMVPLAVTSTRGWQLRLRQNWRRLHRLAYVAAVASVVHFAWLVKADVREPIAWIVGLALLFAMRLPQVRRRLTAVVSRATRRSVARERGATPVSVP